MFFGACEVITSQKEFGQKNLSGISRASVFLLFVTRPFANKKLNHLHADYDVTFRRSFKVGVEQSV